MLTNERKTGKHDFDDRKNWPKLMGDLSFGNFEAELKERIIKKAESVTKTERRDSNQQLQLLGNRVVCVCQQQQRRVKTEEST